MVGEVLWCGAGSGGGEEEEEEEWDVHHGSRDGFIIEVVSNAEFYPNF